MRRMGPFKCHADTSGTRADDTDISFNQGPIIERVGIGMHSNEEVSIFQEVTME